MAGINDAFLNSYRQKAINQLVPGRSIGNRFLRNLNKSYDDKTDMFSGLGFRRFDLGKGETPIGAAGLGLAEGALNIPASLADVYKSIISPIDAGVSTITEAAFDPTLVQGGRKKIAERIARDTSGMELGLPIDTSVPKGKIGSGLATGYTDPDGKKQTTESTFGQSLETRDEVAKRLAELSNKADKANIGVDSYGADKSGDQVVSGEETIDPKGQFSDPEAEAALAEMQQKITENTQLGDMSQEGADIPVATEEDKKVVLSEAELLAKKQKDAFTNLIASVSEETGMGSKKEDGKPKTIEDYKAEFAKATGIDVSGEPDNKMALMSLGLSLMQNRAGKGFDLSKILGSVGEAGQKAMPAFEKARQEARAGQVAAGKFALQQTKADKDALKAANTERAKYLRGRRDVILDRIAETATDQQKAYTKFKFDEAIEFLKQGKKSDKYSQIKTRKLIQGNDVLKVDIGYQGTKPMYANPKDNVRSIVGERKKIYRSLGRIDKLSGIIKDMYNDSAKGIAGTAGQILFDKAISGLSAIGITDAKAWFGERGVSKESEAKTILNLLVQENKRFILKESGNGVSNLDKQDLDKAFGKIKWGNNLQENLNNLVQIKSLFDAPLSTLDSTLDGFISEKDKYQSTDIYNETLDIINSGLNDGFEIKSGSGNNARRINVSDK